MERALLRTRTSALDPGGLAASSIADLTWWMTGSFGFVFLLTMALLAFSIFAEKKNTSPPFGERRFILLFGIAIPAVTMFGLLIYALLLTSGVSPKEEGLKIELTGHMWWWEVHYPESQVRTANEIYVPVGESVQIALDSSDVIHSVWVPSLAGKVDLIPSKKNIYSFTANEPGIYRGQCAEYCGLQHAKMALYVVALPKEEFVSWLNARQIPPLSATKEAKQGFSIFQERGCATCHAIKGTEAISRIGPDLTHIGSRLSLGAGVVENNKGNLAGWISNPQALKPGNKMPRTYLSPEELHTLTSYLLSLK